MGNLVGEKLGHYRIIEQLGVGGMGEVYRARDERHGRDVVVRVLPKEYSDDPVLLKGLERDARAAAGLDHPNVVNVHGVGIHGGRPCVVTDHVTGQSLREAMDSRTLSNRQVIDIGSQIASGLAAAHDAGVIYLGLDPTNVVITDDGVVTLCGIGPVDVAGQREYMPPEHLRGDPVDQRSDIFALGVLLYEMLTGLSPFRRVTPQDSEAAILTEDPPLVSQNTSRVTPAFDGVIRRCLHKRPEDRFQSAHSARSALQTLVTVPEGPSRSRRLPRVAPILLAAVPAVVAAVVAFGLLHMGYRAMLHNRLAVAGAVVRIAVMPFQSHGEADDRETSIRVSDEISSRLAAVNGFVVVTSDDRVGGADLDTELVSGRAKSIDYVLRGSLERIGVKEGEEWIRVRSQLFRRDQTDPLWTESVDHQADDIPALPAEIATLVVGEIQRLESLGKDLRDSP
jgi:serine/threonine protein kinase